MTEFNNFDSIKIGLASPEKILSWSKGEVRKAETINYRTLKPEKDGLFCEKIFGPTKDWECHCGKYKKVKFKGVICDRCGVEITRSKVRRERMGHIRLAAPVSHIWYFKGIPSKMGILLDISPRSLEKILYFAAYVVTNKGNTALEYKQVLSEAEYAAYRETYGDGFEAVMGAEGVKILLESIDLEQLIKELKGQLQNSTGQKRVRLIRRLEVAEAFKKSGNRPEWMILDVLPVIPPDLRPLVQLDGGRFATADLNDLYRRVINRNNRLLRLISLEAPEIIIRNEKRMLQEAVDALIDNGRRGRPVTGPGNRPLKSLSDLLKGKQGRFRQNLLGKRVDYSGRSVIVVGPELKFYQCGLPKKMALELFKPFVMKRLVNDGAVHNIKSAKRKVERESPEVWSIVEDIIQEHPVLLNRAPTLHRLGIQAFEPVLVEGKAIRLHPLVCSAFNADFDGDQMPVHIPLSVEAQAEARFLMLSVNNILAPKDGKPITTPGQDIVLGLYYLTYQDPDQMEVKHYYKDIFEMEMAYQQGLIKLHTMVGVRRVDPATGRSKVVKNTVGRFLFNQYIPQDLGYVDRSVDPFSLEVDFLTKKKDLQGIIARCFHEYGNTKTAILLDNLKDLGFKYSTQSAVSIAVSDMVIPPEKAEYIADAKKVIDEYSKSFRRGLITEEERYKKVVETWNQTTEKVTDALIAGLTDKNNIKIMADSGARGSRNQIRQLAGMRGLMANATGRIVEIPIFSSFRDGLTVLEYFISATGARKGLTDTALKTADSGYLTRRLVDVSQEVIVREEDCGTKVGIEAVEFREGNELIEPFLERITGRFPVADVHHPETGALLCDADTLITGKIAKTICDAGITSLQVRSVLTCDTQHGVCSKCYGVNLATGVQVHVGETVGIIAAQSIGEPGTQLTMRTFQEGGIAGRDITQGLPRVEELFEARKPKGLGLISEIDGVVSFKENKKRREIVITNEETGEQHTSLVVFGARLKVREGDRVVKGQPLTEGSLNPHDLFRVVGTKGVIEYITKEIQKVYRLTGVDINDKHIEIIIKQMLSKIKIEDSGDTLLLPGSVISIKEFDRVNAETVAEGGQPASGTHSLLGITKASLATESFLSAASFQETTRVLTEAAINGKEDKLLGLKENVIIGKLIPAGTGMKYYRDMHVLNEEAVEDEIELALES
ncbi:MAG: DNA-directed RNA polymerase subunit beta' [Bacillota bacterium]|nr:DNA-directed RNA polymerase subunit beta' [Bacillota bacterium]